MKIMICGHARHGKDHAAEYLRDNFGLTFKSSSEAAAEIFIFDELKEKYGYGTFMECFEDRVNHRAEWFDLICDFNKEDKTALAKEILKRTDCYVGMRSTEEAQECLNQGLFDLVIWIDASERKPLESSSSFNIERSVADIIIDNNGTVKDFERRLHAIGSAIYDG